MLGRFHPKVAAMLTDAQADLLPFAVFSRRHWRQICSTNRLERANKEIERRYFSEATMLELNVTNNAAKVIDEAVIVPELAAAWTRTTDPHGVEKLHHSTGRDPGRIWPDISAVIG